jgi:hypothetical protein
MKKLLFFLLALQAGFLAAQSPTFSADIATLIYNKCTFCHRPGEIGPMPFTNYNEVASWASMVKHVTETRYMPPWQPDPAYSSFLGENYLTEQEIQLIKDWVTAGAPEGDPSLTPPLPSFPSGSLLGEPDLVLSFEESWFHEGNNGDTYRVFVLPTGLTETKDIAAIELRPGNNEIVHHALFGWDTTGQAQLNDANDPGYGYTAFGGFGVTGISSNRFQGYVPGQIPRNLPDGIGQQLFAGADLLVQMHYAPWPVDSWDSSSVNIFFKKEPVTRYVKSKIMHPFLGTLVNGPFVIPADSVKRFHGTWTVGSDISLLSITPHMHLLGKDWEVYAVSPQGDTTNLIKIPEWDFNWQGSYTFDQLIKVEQGSIVHAFATYDNTTDNPLNPNHPPQPMRWGENTTEEMYYLPISYVDYQPGDEDIVLSDDELGPMFSFPKNKLYRVYPNPAKDQVNIAWGLGHPEKVNLTLYDMKGQAVKTIQDEAFYPMGKHQLQAEVSDLPNGTYFLRMGAGRYTSALKIMIMD